MTETSSLHIAVVGGGPGGYAAAFLAADLGLKVTLIDPEANPGGVCLYRGCIPSKALLHVAKLIDESRHAKNWGIEYADPKIDLLKKIPHGTGQTYLREALLLSDHNSYHVGQIVMLRRILEGK